MTFDVRALPDDGTWVEGLRVGHPDFWGMLEAASCGEIVLMLPVRDGRLSPPVLMQRVKLACPICKSTAPRKGCGCENCRNYWLWKEDRRANGYTERERRAYGRQGRRT